MESICSLESRDSSFTFTLSSTRVRSWEVEEGGKGEEEGRGKGEGRGRWMKLITGREEKDEEEQLRRGVDGRGLRRGREGGKRKKRRQICYLCFPFCSPPPPHTAAETQTQTDKNQEHQCPAPCSNTDNRFTRQSIEISKCHYSLEHQFSYHTH